MSSSYGPTAQPDGAPQELLQDPPALAAVIEEADSQVERAHLAFLRRGRRPAHVDVCRERAGGHRHPELAALFPPHGPAAEEEGAAPADVEKAHRPGPRQPAPDPRPDADARAQPTVWPGEGARRRAADLGIDRPQDVRRSDEELQGDERARRRP